MTRLRSGPWEKLILLAGLLIAFFLCTGPVFNPDLPWHLKAGQQVAQSGWVPFQESWSWTKAGQPWIDFEWGSQLVFYGVHRAGGMRALWLFKTIVCFLPALILVALVRLWKLPGPWAGFAVAAFMVTLLPSIDVRPEMFSWILFLVQLYLLELRRLGLLRMNGAAALVSHGVLYCLWANLHPGFITGLGLCSFYGVAELLQPSRNKRGLSPLMWAAAGTLGTCVNPYGLRLYAVYLDHWRQWDTLRHLIIEWSNPNLFNGYQRAYWALVLFSFLGLFLASIQNRAIALEHLLAIFAFSLFASRSFRTTAYFALLVFPLSLIVWERLPSPNWWKKVRLWVIGVCFFLGAWNTERLLEERRLLLKSPATIDHLGPARACRFLLQEKDALSNLHLYNPWGWGGYVDYSLDPVYKAFMDGRYLFTDILAEEGIAERNPGLWRHWMDERGIELALLYNNGRMVGHTGMISLRPFDVFAMPRSEWAVVYWDSEALVLARRSAAPAGWIKQHEFRWLRPHDLRETGLRVTAGDISLNDVSSEIDRYRREIGDPQESEMLTQWLAEFKKGVVHRTNHSFERTGVKES